MPAMNATEPGFHAVCTGALKHEGVKGKRAAVTMRAGRLAIVGEEGGAIWIDPADVASMRVGYDESKSGKVFQTNIVRRSRPETLSLHPLARDANYAATIRALAAAVAEAGGIGRIERGTSAFWAWLGPVLMGLLFLAGLAIGLFVLTKDVWWQRFAPALPGAILFGVLLWNTKTRLAPRPIRELGELDRQLP
jgi:hypothetical protein